VGWVLILLNDIYFGFVSFILVIPKFQLTNFLFFRVLDTVEDGIVVVFEAVLN